MDVSSAVLEHQLYAFLGKTADAAFCVNVGPRIRLNGIQSPLDLLDWSQP
jgi:hypothetical protein